MSPIRRGIKEGTAATTGTIYYTINIDDKIEGKESVIVYKTTTSLYRDKTTIAYVHKVTRLFMTLEL